MASIQFKMKVVATKMSLIPKEMSLFNSPDRRKPVSARLSTADLVALATSACYNF